MNRLVSLTFIALLLAVSLSGCATEMGAADGQKSIYHRGIQMDSVGILDRSLQDKKSGKIAVESVGSRRTATDTIEVWAQIRNRTDYPLQIEGRVQFFDKDKAPVEGPGGWKRLHLAPQSLNVFKDFSLGTLNLSHYYIEIREGR